MVGGVCPHPNSWRGNGTLRRLTKCSVGAAARSAEIIFGASTTVRKLKLPGRALAMDDLRVHCLNFTPNFVEAVRILAQMTQAFGSGLAKHHI